MKIKWFKKVSVCLRRFFTPIVWVSTITPEEEIHYKLVSFHGDTYSIFNKDSEGKKKEEPEFKLVFHRHGLINYIDIIIHPDKIGAINEKNNSR